MYKLKRYRWYFTFVFVVYGALTDLVESRPVEKQNQLTSEQRRIAIKRHKLMTELHGELTRCLEAGKSYETCHQEAALRCKQSFGGMCPGYSPLGLKPDSPRREHGCFWMLPKDDGSNDADKLPSK